MAVEADLATRADPRPTLLVGVFALAILVSAALLFLVQPMFARMVLPLLGGSPAVWNTALVFYQVVLLAGYAYAYAATRWLSLRAQVILHLFVLALPFLVLPVGLPKGWIPPTTENPVFWLLSLLGVAVGLPFFVVAATSPLLQRWFAASRQTIAGDPYFLYGASNLGSLLALLGYPLVVERWLRLGEQSRWWAGGYGLLVILIVGCAAVIWRTGRTPAADTAFTGESAPITWRDRCLWTGLAAMPVSFMLSVTTYISTDISPIPLLWVIPLSLYLLTFILTFARRPVVPATLLVRVLPVALALLAFLLATAKDFTGWSLILAHLAVFFVASLVTHGELARRRPSPRYLTEFYLWISFGGAVGGIFNAIVAPFLFDHVLEYPLTLMAAAMLLPQIAKPATAASRRSPQKRRADSRAGKQKGLEAPRFSRKTLVLDAFLPAAVLALAAIFVLGLLDADRGLVWSSRVMAFGPPAVISIAFSRRPLRFALSLGAIMLASTLYSGKGTYLYTDRTFFGINSVILFASGGYHMLDHGNTLHGAQSLEPARRHELLTYYAASGPVGDIFAHLDARGTSNRVAVVGLGAGSIACYRRAGEAWTFYEIDPAVVRIARDPQYFTFLTDCAPEARIVVGDARVRLAAAGKSEYDVIVLDAYTSDAIPIHLITREAFEIYLDKLAPGGMLVINISNRQFELKTVLGNVAKNLNLAFRARDDQQLTIQEENRGKLPSQWAVLARANADLGQLTRDPRWVIPGIRPGTAVWTDDFNNLLSVLNWSR